MKSAKVFAALTVSALLTSPTFAAETPLPTGKPAGVQQAALLGRGWLVGIGVAGLSIALATGAFNSKSTSATGTSS